MVALAMATGATEEGRREPERKQDRPIRLYYQCEEVMRLLQYWPMWQTDLAFVRKRFEEGGQIERQQVREEGGFCDLVAQYADLEYALLRLRASRGWLEEQVVRDRWERDLDQDKIAANRRMSNGAVTALLWGGTERVMEYMTRDPGAVIWVKNWREDHRGRNRYDDS